MYLDTAVVTYKTKIAKAVHEEANAGARGADHIRQCLLCNSGDEGSRRTRLAEFRHQQENPREALFAGIEKLIDKIGLDAHAADQQKLEEYVGKGWLVVHHANHFISANLQRGAGADGGSGCQMQ